MAVKFLDDAVEEQPRQKTSVRFFDDSTTGNVTARPKTSVRFTDEQGQDGQGFLETVGDYAIGAVGAFADVGYATLEGVGALVGVATGDQSFARAVSEFRNYSEDFYTGDVPEHIKDNFSYKATQAIGQMPAYAVFAMTGPIGLGALGANAFQQGRDDYLQTMGVTSETATPEQLSEANKVGGVTAVPLLLLERFGAGKLVSSVFKDATEVTAKEAIKRISGATIAEGATEGLQTALQNTVASELMQYDEDRPITQGVVESIALGAIASGALSGPVNISEVAINRLNAGIQNNEINPKDLGDPELGGKFAETIIEEGTAPPVASSKAKSRYSGNAKEFINDLIEPISAQLGKISSRAKAEIRRMEQRIGTIENQRVQRVKPFLQKLRKLEKTSPKDYNVLTRELFNGENGDQEIVANILKSNAMDQDYAEVRVVLDEIYKDAVDLGMKSGDGKQQYVGYLEEYFPRSVKDLEGLMNSYENVIPRNEFERLVKREEAEQGRSLTPRERELLLESFVKGNLRRRVGSIRPQSTKERKIQTIDDSRLQYYHRPQKALADYIQNMTTGIETKRFLGVTEVAEEGGMNRVRIAGRLGKVLDEEMQAGKLNNRDLDAIKIILQSRFGQKSPQNSIIQGAKNLGYIATMGNFGSAITQLSEFYFGAYQNNILPMVKAFPRAAIGKADVTLEDIGVSKDQVTIEAQEAGGFLNDVLNWTFKMSGLTQLDRIAKETNISSAYNNARRAVKNKDSGKFRLLKGKLVSMQGEQQAQQTIADLENGVKSDGVLEMLFSQLSDVAPISMSEMPPMYAANPNGRMLYMLKSYTIKQFNFLREEAFRNIVQINNPKKVVTGFKNLLRLATLAMLANGTADILKDILFNREIDPEDIMWDNILRLFGLSRYTTRIGAREGPGQALVKTILPPQVNIIDDISKDVTSGAYDLADMRSAKYIPLIGKLYYWQEGRGKEMETLYKFKD